MCQCIVNMKVVLVFTIILSSHCFQTDSILLPVNLEATSQVPTEAPETRTHLSTSSNAMRENYEEQNGEDYVVAEERGKKEETTKQPCSIVVLSNVQNPGMQSLLRRYRYDSNGILIPSSVKYYLKMPSQGHDNPILVPLHDKAFSPVGGFVRYYKEVPPIPPSW